MNRLAQFLPALLAIVVVACSGKGDDLIDPDANERTETALLAIDTDGGGELARYYEVDGIIGQEEYEGANGEALGGEIDALYEAYENVYLHDNAAGRITVVSLGNRKKLATIEGLPSGDEGTLCGMAFSNLSQGWVIAYGSDNIYHLDVRNFALVGGIPLPANPTAVATTDNRVFIGMEEPDGSGAIGVMASNDPDFKVDLKVDLPRAPFFMQVDGESDYLIVLVPGAETDDPNTRDIETDPVLYIVDLIDYSVADNLPFLAPPMRDYVGRQPTFASMSKDSYLYLATSEGVKRLDTRSVGSVNDYLPGKSYSALAVDYWTDLLYAVPTGAPNTVERKTKRGETLPSFTLDHPISSLVFVSTSKVNNGGR